MLHSGLSEPKISGDSGMHSQAGGSTGQILDELLRRSVSPKTNSAAICNHRHVQQQPQHGVPPGNTLSSNAGSNDSAVAAGQEPPVGPHYQLLAQQQHPQLHTGQLHSAVPAGTSALAINPHPAGVDRALVRDLVPSFSGWSDAAVQPGQLQYPVSGPHPPPGGALHSSGRPHHPQDDEHALHCAAEAAAVHCSFLASGQRARRKSSSDAAPHHHPCVPSRRRKSDSGLHSSAFTGNRPAFLAGSATSGSTSSGSGGTSPAWMGLSVSLPGGGLPTDQHSCSSASSQQHHLTSIMEGLPLTDVQLPAPGSPGRSLRAPGSPGWHDQLQEQEEQQRWQQQHLQLERELLQHEQLAKQKRLELQQLMQQQQHRLAGTSELGRHSPTPPSYAGGVPGFCISPKAALLHKQLAQDGSSASGAAASSISGSSRRAATEPPPSHSSEATASSSSMPSGRSPGAAAMVLTSSRALGSTSLPQARQHMLLDASDAAAAAAAHAAVAAPGRAPPVARDITKRLQQQHAAASTGQPSHSHAGSALELQHSSNIWGLSMEWSQHGVDPARQSSSHIQQQLAAAAANHHAAPASPAAAHALREVHQRMQPQQQEQELEQLSLEGPAGGVVGVKPSRITPVRSNSFAMSPAPPPVPPSPHQQHAAELRVRRSSCSSIPGSWPAPSPRSAAAGIGCDHPMGVLGMGQPVARQLGRAGSSGVITPNLTVRVTTPEPPTDILTDSMWEAHCQAQHSPSGSPITRHQHSSGRDTGPEQREAQEPSGFLLQQEQRLLLGRDQGPSAAGAAAAAGCGSLSGESSIREALDKLHGASSSLQFVGAPPGQQHHPAPSLASSRTASDGSQQQAQAGIKTLSAQVLGPHKAAAAPGGPGAFSGLPPPHPVHQHSDVPSTPRTHLLIGTPRSASAVFCQQQQQQQPVPPKQHAPSCRSPCVSARLHAAALSPGPAAEAWLQSSSFAAQHTCSPILEQVPNAPGSGSSSTGSTKGSSAEGRAAHASGPGSSSSSIGLDPSAASSSAGCISITTDSSSGSRSARLQTPGMDILLPRPAFEQLPRAVSLDSSYAQQQQSTGMRSPSPPAAPDAAAALLGCSRPLRAGSPVVRKQPPVLAGAGVAGKALQLQRLQVAKSPSPPPMMASPRVGGLVVQPCPPLNSLPPVSPSPSVRTRVLAQPSSQAAMQQGEEAALAASSAADAAAAGLHAEGTGSKPAWAGSSPVVAAHAAHRGALSYSSTSGRAPAAAGHAAMLPGRDSSGASGQAAAAPQRPGWPQALLQPSLATSTPSESGSGTPVVSWMQPARHATSCLSSSEPQQDGPMTDRGPATAGAEVGKDGAAGWAAVAAFSHYRGRLGYLMNSGVVGVLFEDQASMLMQADRHTVCYIQPASSTAAGAAGEEGSAVASKGKDCARPPAAAMSRRISTDLGHSDQSSATATADAAVGSAAAAAGQGSSVLADCDGLTCQTFHLPAALDSAGSSSDAGGSSNSSSPGVPEHLASKLRCLQRFVGCLLHHQQYSSKRHLDVTRLVLPDDMALQQPPQQEQLQPPPVVLPVHVAHFNASEGCVLLSLTDGSQQLVFMSDSSIMLLRPGGLQQLAFVPPPQKHKRKPHARSSGAEQSAAAAGDGAGDSCSDSDSCDSDSSSDSDTSGPGSACASAKLAVVPLGVAASALPQDPRLLARLKQASRLPGVPPLFVDALTA